MQTRPYDVPEYADAPCGNIAYFDEGSGIGYRCESCNAIIGSVGMPRACKALMDMEEVVNKLKGKNGR